MSKGKNAIMISLGALLVAAIFVSIYLYNQSLKLTAKNKSLEEDKLKLILDSLKRSPDLSDEIKRQIEKMILEFEKVDPNISNQLAEALQLFQIGQPEGAIQGLVKIIEHLLTLHYKEDHRFKNWLKEQKKKFDLHNLLTFCKKENKISDIEFQFFVGIKTIRNKEAHAINLKLDNYLTVVGLITAIGAILKVASIVYPKKKSIEK